MATAVTTALHVDMAPALIVATLANGVVMATTLQETSTQSWLGILIFGPNSWDPLWKQNPNSVSNSRDFGQISFLTFQFLEIQKIGIPICKI